MGRSKASKQGTADSKRRDTPVPRQADVGREDPLQRPSNGLRSDGDLRADRERRVREASDKLAGSDEQFVVAALNDLFDLYHPMIMCGTWQPSAHLIPYEHLFRLLSSPSTEVKHRVADFFRRSPGDPYVTALTISKVLPTVDDPPLLNKMLDILKGCSGDVAVLAKDSLIAILNRDLPFDTISQVLDVLEGFAPQDVLKFADELCKCIGKMDYPDCFVRLTRLFITKMKCVERPPEIAAIFTRCLNKAEAMEALIRVGEAGRRVRQAIETPSKRPNSTAKSPARPTSKQPYEVVGNSVRIVDRTYDLEPHQAILLIELLKASADHKILTSDDFCELSGCTSKNVSREFKKLLEAVPPLGHLMNSKSGRGGGYYLK